jgi:hypothetical protein
MELAFSTRNPHVERGNRWIASLSDGSTVFEDKQPGVKSAWRRLSDYVKFHKLQITNLRLEVYGRSVTLLPYKDAHDRPQLDGYWHSSKMGAFLGVDGTGQRNWRGIGYVKNDTVTIIWVGDDGSISQEERDFTEGNPAAIINEV